jgi:hypothetical protein
METFTYPITQHQIRDTIRAAQSLGEAMLNEFKERTSKHKAGYNLNWGDLSLSSVGINFDEDAKPTVVFTYTEGDCPLFNCYMRDDLCEHVPADFNVEVRSEW